MDAGSPMKPDRKPQVIPNKKEPLRVEPYLARWHFQDLRSLLSLNPDETESDIYYAPVVPHQQGVTLVRHVVYRGQRGRSGSEFLGFMAANLNYKTREVFIARCVLKAGNKYAFSYLFETTIKRLEVCMGDDFFDILVPDDQLVTHLELKALDWRAVQVISRGDITYYRFKRTHTE